jgi:GNAT superfamily N-acetyltransferase
MLVDGTYYLTEADGVITGCGGWSKRNTLYGGDQHKAKEDPLLDPNEGCGDGSGHSSSIPDHARQGIGRQLINACEAAAQANGFHHDGAWRNPARRAALRGIGLRRC